MIVEQGRTYTAPHQGQHTVMIAGTEGGTVEVLISNDDLPFTSLHTYKVGDKPEGLTLANCSVEFVITGDAQLSIKPDLL